MKDGDPPRSDRGQGLPQLKTGQHHDLSADHGCVVQHRRHGEDVEKRQHREHALLSWHGGWPMGGHLAAIGGEIGMGQHRAFRHPGRPASVLQDGNRMRRIDGDRRGRLPARKQASEGPVKRIDRDRGAVPALEHAEQRALQRRQDVRHGTDDDALQSRRVRNVRDPAIDRLQVEDGHDPGAGITDLVGQLPFDVERVEIHHRPAGLERGVVEDHVIGRVRQAQTDLHAGTNARVLQSAARAVDQSAERRVGPAAAQEIHGGA